MKIARAVAAIKTGRQSDLSLGSLTGQRDWAGPLTTLGACG